MKCCRTLRLTALLAESTATNLFQHHSKDNHEYFLSHDVAEIEEKNWWWRVARNKSRYSHLQNPKCVHKSSNGNSVKDKISLVELNKINCSKEWLSISDDKKQCRNEIVNCEADLNYKWIKIQIIKIKLKTKHTGNGHTHRSYTQL